VVGLNDSLLASEEKEMLLTISLKEGTVLPTSNVSISNIGYTITYVQKTSGGGTSDDLVVQNPTTIGCTLEDVQYGVTRTEQNTLCWDGDYEKYPYILKGEQSIDLNDGTSVNARIVWVKISNKVIDPETYDGSNYLMHFNNPGNVGLDEDIVASNNFAGLNTLKTQSADIEDGLIMWGFEVMSKSENSTSFSELTPGIWVFCYIDIETGELLIYVDALTIPGEDFTGTSTRIEDPNNVVEITSSSLLVKYDGNSSGKEMIRFMDMAEDGVTFGNSYLVKVSELSETQKTNFEEFLQKTENAQDTDTVYTLMKMTYDSTTTNTIVDQTQTIGELTEYDEFPMKLTEKIFAFEGAFVSFGDTYNDVEVPEGVYAMYATVFDEYVSAIGCSEVYGSETYIKLNF